VLLSALRLWQGLQSIIRLIGPERLEDGSPPAGQINAFCRAAGSETFGELQDLMKSTAARVRQVFAVLIVDAADESDRGCQE